MRLYSPVSYRCTFLAFAATVFRTFAIQQVPLLGEYGFLTVYDGISEDEARLRIKQMVSLFKVMEFQFYDAFRGYSAPPLDDDLFWRNKAFGRPVQRNILSAYIGEIHRHGGRAWLYVQTVATDPGDLDMQVGFSLAGQHVVDNRPLLDAIAPNAAWARKIAPGWSKFASRLGFDGIHWDTLGSFSAAMQANTDLPGFLLESRKILDQYQLQQTANFVDGFGWNPILIQESQPGGRTVAFPYWETWNVPEQEQFFYNNVAPGPNGGGVFVCYPGRGPQHTGEVQNTGFVGVWPLDLLIDRWVKARRAGNTYLAIGDGVRHIETQYFPANVGISDADIIKIQQKVFGNYAVADPAQKIIGNWLVMNRLSEPMPFRSAYNLTLFSIVCMVISVAAYMQVRHHIFRFCAAGMSAQGSDSTWGLLPNRDSRPIK